MNTSALKKDVFAFYGLSIFLFTLSILTDVKNCVCICRAKKMPIKAFLQLKILLVRRSVETSNPLISQSKSFSNPSTHWMNSMCLTLVIYVNYRKTTKSHLLFQINTNLPIFPGRDQGAGWLGILCMYQCISIFLLTIADPFMCASLMQVRRWMNQYGTWKKVLRALYCKHGGTIWRLII